MIRKFDKLGRIVIPKEMREQIGFTDQAEAEINISGDKIIISNPKNFDIEEFLEEKIKEHQDDMDIKWVYIEILDKIKENE